jgi:hypothetical protein
MQLLILNAADAWHFCGLPHRLPRRTKKLLDEVTTAVARTKIHPKFLGGDRDFALLTEVRDV